MRMYFHGNQHPLSIKHPYISLKSLYFKYQSFEFISLLDMGSSVVITLDAIYCNMVLGNLHRQRVVKVCEFFCPRQTVFISDYEVAVLHSVFLCGFKTLS